MSEARLNGLVAVRIAWITGIVVCALAILIELFSGTGTGDSSQQLPGFAFSAGRDSSRHSPGFTLLDRAAAMSDAAAQENRSGGGKEGAPGDSHSPPRSGSQPEYTGGSTPVVTRRPKPPRAPGGDPAGAPQAPSVTPQELPELPKLPKEPSVEPPKPPKPPKEPSVEPPKPPKQPKEPSVAPPKPPKPPKP